MLGGFRIHAESESVVDETQIINSYNLLVNRFYDYYLEKGTPRHDAKCRMFRVKARIVLMFMRRLKILALISWLKN